jgi:hypothetical protein
MAMSQQQDFISNCFITPNIVALLHTHQQPPVPLSIQLKQQSHLRLQPQLHFHQSPCAPSHTLPCLPVLLLQRLLSSSVPSSPTPHSASPATTRASRPTSTNALLAKQASTPSPSPRASNLQTTHSTPQLTFPPSPRIHSRPLRNQRPADRHPLPALHHRRGTPAPRRRRGRPLRALHAQARLRDMGVPHD